MRKSFFFNLILSFVLWNLDFWEMEMILFGTQVTWDFSGIGFLLKTQKFLINLLSFLMGCIFLIVVFVMNEANVFPFLWVNRMTNILYHWLLLFVSVIYFINYGNGRQDHTPINLILFLLVGKSYAIAGLAIVAQKIFFFSFSFWLSYGFYQTNKGLLVILIGHAVYLSFFVTPNSWDRQTLFYVFVSPFRRDKAK